MARYQLLKPLKAASYDPSKYGLVPDAHVALDRALADPALAAALEACRADDWQPAMAALESVGKDWDQRGVYVHALGAFAGGRKWLGSWRDAQPSSPDAAAIYAQSLVVQAWIVRGTSSSAGTTRKQFEGFHEILRTAADAAMKAADMAPEDPTPWMTMVTVARGLQFSNTDFERIWQELLIRDSTNRRAHVQALQYWQPKWFGSLQQAKSFVDDTAARVQHSALAFELRLDNQMEIWLPRLAKVDQATFFRRGPGRGPLREALEDYWTGTVPAGGGQAALDRNWLAWALTMANRWDDACKVWLALGGCLNDGSPWRYRRDGVEAFTGLRREAFIMSSLKPTA
jgi:hypothetical protein